MKIKLTEQQLRRVIVEQQSKIGAILMTGITRSKSHEGQKKDFINGFGSENVAAFPYNKYEISDFLETIKENPNIPVVLFSAAGRHAEAAAAVMNDKNNLFLVEPWWSGDEDGPVYISVQNSGVPPENVQVGRYTGTGKGIID